MTTAFGRDINEYYNNHFSPYAFFQDLTPIAEEWAEEYENEEGELFLPGDEQFELTAFGNVYSSERRTLLGTFESLFLTWLSQQTTAQITIEVPRTLYDELRKHLDDLGCKIVR